jgi:hypothetical protein
MQSAIGELQVSSKDLPNHAALKLGRTPLLRYSDPTRNVGNQTTGLLDAGVWRVGERGRPTALITLELYRTPASKVVLSYEFLSLISSRLDVVSPRGPTWSPAGTDLKVAQIPGTPKPAAAPAGRLVQMRQISRRFAVHEMLSKDEKIECRLLAQPIDRYSDETAGIADGAIFIFANGTNPEVGLLLECDADQWSYGAVRLSAAALFVDLDENRVFEAAQSFGQPRTAPYRGVVLPVPLEE